MLICWVLLICFFLFSILEVKCSKLPKPPFYYAQGTADPDRDPLATITPDGYTCSNVTAECYCKGKQCTLLPQDAQVTNFTTVTLTYTTIKTVPARSFVSKPEITILDIIQSSLKIIEPYAFYGLKDLKVLNLCFNKITSLNPEALEGLESLEELILLKNGFQSLDAIVPALIPTILPTLQLLMLSGNSLKGIKQNSFEKLKGSKLDKLHMMLCDLTYIHPEGLKPLTNLKTLMIRGNDQLNEDILSAVIENLVDSDLDTLDIGAVRFNNLPVRLLNVLARSGVNALYLYGLPLTSLAHNSFPAMPNLTSLTLNGNHLKMIEDGALNLLKSLKSLMIPKNLLTYFPKALQIMQLEELNLSGFRKQPLTFELPELSFSNMAELRSLDLSYKSLLSLNKNTFYGLSNLTELNLRKGGINSIDGEAFVHLTSLRYLDISENPLFELGNVSQMLFYGLGSTLTSLVLHDSGYQGDNDNFWVNLGSLQILDVSNNTLSSISKIVSSLGNLQKLYASSNNIRYWEQSILAENRSLETLDLSRNSLRTIPEAMISDFEKIRHINISSNPFQCSCDLLDFLLWLRSTPSSVSLYKRSRRSTNDYSICSESSNSYSKMDVVTLTNALIPDCDFSAQRKAQLMLTIFAAFLIISFSFTLFIYVFRRKVHNVLWGKDPSKGHFMYDAFVSYSANDSDWVFNSLLPHIEGSTSNLRLCVYDRDFIAGEAITDCILESIKNSRRVILVISNSFIKSPWCRLETDLAHHVLLDENRDGLLLIRYGPVDLAEVHPQLRYLLSTRLYLVWGSDPKDQSVFWNKLKKVLDYHTKSESKTGQRSELV